MTEVPARPYADLPSLRPMKHKHRGGPRSHTVPLETRLWDEVDKSGDCWQWTGARNWKGYGRIGVGNRKTVGVHRVAYMLTHPDQDITGVQIDHTCHGRDESCPGDRTCAHRRCVNPAHLEAVDNRTNTERSQNFMAERIRGVRQNRCGRGHELTPDNVYDYGNGRSCKTCTSAKWRDPAFKARQNELRNQRRRAMQGHTPEGRRVEQATDSWFAPAIPVLPPTGGVRVRRARPDGPDVV